MWRPRRNIIASRVEPLDAGIFSSVIPTLAAHYKNGRAATQIVAELL